jgi:hypothetical protein
MKSSQRLKAILEFVFRIYVFTFLNIYAIGKLLGGQFYTPETIPEHVSSTSLGSASNFDLAWTFMGRSYGYILFIGISQMLGSCLLLFNKTKLLGATMLIPIMVNIIVFDVFFLDKYGALASASIYFSMLLFILMFNQGRVISSLKSLINTAPKKANPWKNDVLKITFSVILFLLIFLFDQWLVSLLGHGKG